MKLGMSDPWDMRTDIGGSSSRSQGQGHRVTSINTEGPILCTVCDGVSASVVLTLDGLAPFLNDLSHSNP